MRNFETFLARPSYVIEPYVDPIPVDFNDPQAIADCLIKNDDFECYALMGQFCDRDVAEMALESAHNIINSRRPASEQPIDSTAPVTLPVKTEYVARMTRLDEPFRISA